MELFQQPASLWHSNIRQDDRQDSSDECFGGPAKSGDAAFDKDWNQAQETVCKPWLTEHYLKWFALGVVTLAFLIEGQRRKQRARTATG